jgi:hypothetical protein
MDAQRLEGLLREAGVDVDAPHASTTESLTDLVTSALELVGIEAEELERLSESLQGKAKTSAMAIGLGAGLSAFALATSAPFVDLAVDAGARIVNFLIDNPDVLAAGWVALVNPLATISAEVIFHLPGGTLDLGVALADATHLAHDLIATALAEGGHLGDIVDALTTAADALDIADIATTLGIGWLIGWVAGNIVEEYYAPKIEALKAQVLRVQEKQEGLERLKEALRLKLPPALITPLLEKVESNHWGL